MSYSFVDSFRAGPGWNECTANELLMMDEGTVRNMP